MRITGGVPTIGTLTSADASADRRFAPVNLVAALITLAAALIAAFGNVPQWFMAVLAGVAVIAVTAPAWPLARTVASGVLDSRRKRRIGERLAREAYELGRRMQFHTNLGHAGSMADAYFSLNQNGIYGEVAAPHPFPLHSALDSALGLLADAANGKVDPVRALTVFDLAFAGFNLHHIKLPGDRAAKAAERLEPYHREVIRKARARYDLVIEGYRELAERIHRDLGISVGRWCHEMPPYV